MEAAFDELMRRVRKGDADAAAEIVRRFESPVRVAVRIRLTDPTLRRQFDSMDICQSVLASFFFRAACGEFDVQHPTQLVALLTKMARNKLATQARNNRRQRRDVRRVTARTPTAFAKLVSRSPGPARQAEGRELLREAWQRMDHQLRQIASRRIDGQSWDQVASAMGGSAEARRKEYQRGLDVIANLLGIDDDAEICTE
jgi:RNA polymerase sigma-70 factor (ECF subfamily)